MELKHLQLDVCHVIVSHILLSHLYFYFLNKKLENALKTLGLSYPTDVECSVGSIFQQAWSQNYVPKGCPASSIVTLHFDQTVKNDSKIEMVWMDGGLRPSHPEFIPADDFLGEKNSTNGVLMIGEKGVISCGVYALNPKLYVKGQKTVEFSTDNQVDSLDHIHHMEWINGIKAGYGSNEYKKITKYKFDFVSHHKSQKKSYYF